MNPEPPLTPREELEVRVTALLMGELTAEEAAAVQSQIDRDPNLTVLHAGLRRAMVLLREASTIPEPATLKFSSPCRERLLATFQGIAAAPIAAKLRREWSWIVPLALAASLIALIGGSLLVPDLAVRKAGSSAASSDFEVGVVQEAQEKSSSFRAPARPSTEALAQVDKLSSTAPAEPNQLFDSAPPRPLVLAPGKDGSEPLSATLASAPSLPASEAPPPSAAPAPVTATSSPSQPVDRAQLFAKVDDAEMRAAGEQEQELSKSLSTAGKIELPQLNRGGIADRLEVAPASLPTIVAPTTTPGEQPASSSTLDFFSDNGPAEGVTKPQLRTYNPSGAEAQTNEARNSAKKELEDRMEIAKNVLGEVKKLDEEIARPELSKEARESKAMSRGEKAAELQQMDRELRAFQQTREKELQEQSVRMRGAAASGVQSAGRLSDRFESQLGLAGEAAASMKDKQAQLSLKLKIDPKAGGGDNEARSQAIRNLDVAWSNPVRWFDPDWDRGISKNIDGGLEAKSGVPALKLTEAIEETAGEKDVARKAKPSASEPQPEIQTRANAFSTFSLNVSDVAFKLAGASLEQGQMPEPAGVRSEEFINAFDYRDPEPAPRAPLAFATERARYPFAQNRDLLRLSVKTAAAGRQPGRALNVVLLLDNSGSMERADRVRIVREALRVLAGQLQPADKLSIVTFARTPRLWIDGISGDKAGEATARVAEITPQGGTNISAALDLGYATALRHYQAGSINRVVLLTDGAANLGDVNPEALKQKVEAHRRQGIALDCFGVGWEGYDDAVLEALSRNGDGRYGFLNTPEQAATEFAAQLAGALRVAASDVKVQVEFNPRRVTAYRQIGYAKHQLTKEQFRDNTVDAAEIGAAESGTALYVVEVNPRGEGDLATVRMRFKVPGTSDFREHEWAVPFTAPAPPLEQASPALRLAAAASAFSEMLAASPYAAEVTSDALLGLLNGVPATYGADPRPQRLEWMIRQAKSLSGR